MTYTASRTYVRNAYATAPGTARFQLERVRYLLKCGIVAASWQRAALQRMERDLCAVIAAR